MFIFRCSLRFSAREESLMFLPRLSVCHVSRIGVVNLHDRGCFFFATVVTLGSQCWNTLLRNDIKTGNCCNTLFRNDLGSHLCMNDLKYSSFGPHYCNRDLRDTFRMCVHLSNLVGVSCSDIIVVHGMANPHVAGGTDSL
jgi:hypothetical protein